MNEIGSSQKTHQLLNSLIHLDSPNINKKWNPANKCRKHISSHPTPRISKSSQRSLMEVAHQVTILKAKAKAVRVTVQAPTRTKIIKVLQDPRIHKMTLPLHQRKRCHNNTLTLCLDLLLILRCSTMCRCIQSKNLQYLDSL